MSIKKKNGVAFLEYLIIVMLVAGAGVATTKFTMNHLERAMYTDTQFYNSETILIRDKQVVILSLLNDNDMKLYKLDSDEIYIVISRRGKVTYYPNGKSAENPIYLITEKEYASGIHSFDLPSEFGRVGRIVRGDDNVEIIYEKA